MIKRQAITGLRKALERQAAVGLIGPRQVGKTTLARMVAEEQPSIYLDLESPQDRAKLNDPELFLKDKEDMLVILDEIHRVPELFPVLRGIIDSGRRKGKRTGRFLVLGSASVELLRQSSETLAGRIEYIYLNPLNILEIENSDKAKNKLWLRGGFPESYLAKNEMDSFDWRGNFIRTYLERDVMQYAPRISTERLDRFWQMLAHSQGTFLNASRLASGLSVDTHTINNYIELLMNLLLVRRLPAYHNNRGKRLVKAPKIYLRDSGLLHTLLGIRTRDELLGHPILGASWEGFVLENLLSVLPPHAKPYVYRSSGGAEMDLVLDLGGKKGIWAIEIKHGLEPKPTRGFYNAIQDIQPSKSFILYSGNERFPLGGGMEILTDIKRLSNVRALADIQPLGSREAIGLREMAELLIKI